MVKKKRTEHTRPSVWDFKTRKRIVARDDVMELLDVMESYVQQLHQKRPDQDRLDQALLILKEIKWCAFFNHEFREATYNELEELSDKLYVEINDGYQD
jgi:hypothetical protein